MDARVCRLCFRAYRDYRTADSAMLFRGQQREMAGGEGSGDSFCSRWNTSVTGASNAPSSD